MKTSGWQEVALHHSPEMNARIAPRFAGVYCWSTIGKRDVVPYTVANEGYDVILCNVNNLYIDLAYNPHKDEPGLTWGGYVNEFTSFNILPYNIYCSARENTAGEKNNLKTAGKGRYSSQNNRVHASKAYRRNFSPRPSAVSIWYNTMYSPKFSVW